MGATFEKTRPKTAWTTTRLLRAFGLLLRVFVVLVSLEFSGVAAAISEGFCSDEASADCCTDCPLEKDGKECPPGCPNCHSYHGGIALAPVFETVTARVIEIDDNIVQRSHEAGVPHAPQLPGVYRPPRLDPSSVGRVAERMTSSRS